MPNEPDILYPNGQLLAVQCFIDDPIAGRIPWNGQISVAPAAGAATSTNQLAEIAWLSTISGQLATTLPVLVTNTTPIPVSASFAASDTTGTGTLNTTNAAITVAVTSCGGVAFQLASGGNLNGTLFFEGSTDGGTTWGTIYVSYNGLVFGLPPTQIIWTASVFASFFNTGTLIYANAVGLTHIRVRVQNYNSGSSVGFLVATRNVPQIGQPPFAQGNAQWMRITDPDGLTLGVDVNSTQRSLNVGLRDIRGTSVDTSTGNATAGTQRVILATNQPAINTTVTGTVAISTTAINATISNTILATVSGSVAITNTAFNATISNPITFTNTAINATISNTILATVSGSVAITNTAFNATISNPITFTNTAINATISNPVTITNTAINSTVTGVVAVSNMIPAVETGLAKDVTLSTFSAKFSDFAFGTTTPTTIRFVLPLDQMGAATPDAPFANSMLDRLMRIEQAILRNTKVVASEASTKQIVALLAKTPQPTPSLPAYANFRGLR